jgi:hypothetical protein
MDDGAVAENMLSKTELMSIKFMVELQETYQTLPSATSAITGKMKELFLSFVSSFLVCVISHKKLYG